MVTQLVVELNLLETGRNTLSRSLKRERARAHAQIYSKHEAPMGEVRRLGVELNLLEPEENLFLDPLHGKEVVLTLGLLKARNSFVGKT